MFSKLRQFSLLVVCSAITLTTRSQVNPTPAGERMQVLDQRRKLERQSLLNEVQFRSIGPNIMSGRVVDVDANPEDPTEFYVAYATGGLWHTTNNGQSFIPIMDSLDMLFIGDIAVNWKTKIIWVGTGEVNSSRSSYAGVGMYKTNNNGKPGNIWACPNHIISAKCNCILPIRTSPGWQYWDIYILPTKTGVFTKQQMVAKHGNKPCMWMRTPVVLTLT